ncbi:Uncharacterized protein TCM_005015 [Theobroma cacao]|uniref:Uncharacterized protein n=1 Tax=Theobroma cacao TaxID=3641 RepID=A0A061DT19_THECC|nr:Uncharacterized protein TCM_005015 [Theobroma cacao]
MKYGGREWTADHLIIELYSDYVNKSVIHMHFGKVGHFGGSSAMYGLRGRYTFSCGFGFTFGWKGYNQNKFYHHNAWSRFNLKTQNSF